MVFGLHQFYVQFRHVAHARHVVIKEIRLLHRAVNDADAFYQRQPQAVYDGTFSLCDDVIRMHGHTAVDGAPEIVHLDCAAGLVYGHIGNTRHMRAGIIHIRNTQTVAGTLAPPVGHFYGLLDHVARAWLTLEQAQTKFRRIDARFRRQFINKHFGGKTIGGQADAA